MRYFLETDVMWVVLGQSFCVKEVMKSKIVNVSLFN